eukprot:TRINITY_DN258_c0_g1_i2.p1 TRINITY_DN258_c0_g1~~TRINITY_DN258_c0_g1_i2.p1  ORF type:complete len:359 (+),score=57.27 TRINITY_DN258_c0_g1_i2:404-1480(+)
MKRRQSLKGHRNREAVAAAERRLYEATGLASLPGFAVRDVPIGDEDDFIHTVSVGREDKPTLVLLHGYGGSSVFFHQLILHLVGDFRIHAIDLLGMGLSSRKPFLLEDAEETARFFEESIEEWSSSMKLTTFNLAGHSFGGYLALIYTSRNPKKVEHLFLISPAGLTKPTVMTREEREEALSKQPLITRMYLRVFNCLFRRKISPFRLVRGLGLIGRCVFQFVLRRKFRIKDERERLAFYEYMSGVAALPPGSEVSVQNLLTESISGRLHIDPDVLSREFEGTILVYFGARDWMDWTGAMTLCQRFSGASQISFIPGAGHHIALDNACGLAERMISDVRLTTERLRRLRCFKESRVFK